MHVSTVVKSSAPRAVSTDFYFCVSNVHIFVFIGFRAVRGVVGHGDAPGSEDHHESRGGVFGTCVRPLRHAHRVHPTSHGRFVGVPPRSPTSLVSLIVPADLDVHDV